MSTIVVTPPAAAALVAVLKPSLKLNTNVDKNEKKYIFTKFTSEFALVH